MFEEKKKIILLGSTGSIGRQTLDVIRACGETFEVEALTCDKNIAEIENQIREFNPKAVSVSKESDAEKLRKRLKDFGITKTEVMSGKAGLLAISEMDCHIAVNALVGIAGFLPTVKIIERGRKLALANKESLVVGGKIITELIQSSGAEILPVDSEHSAIFQCMQGRADNDIRRIILTASGGPFRGYTKEQLEKVNSKEALRHPTWKMGRKITIDSATMMNKGFEVIEAKWLFNIDTSKIDVVVHPESIVHSAVEFCDGAIVAQMGKTDMKLPISYAMNYPERVKLSEEPPLDFFGAASKLTFEKPDMENFKCLKLAYEADKMGGSYPAVLNSANEILVNKFLNEEIGFLDIADKLEMILESHNGIQNPEISDITEIDREMRERL